MQQNDNCARKKAYATRWEAEETARHQMSQRPGLVLRVYQCDRGPHYHLTHKPARF